MTRLNAFDPRAVPVVRIDHHLPAVDASQLRPQALRARFAHAPAWQPELVQEKRFLDREPAAAAVLIGLVMREHLSVLLTQRTAHLSTHSGQIAFAGGKSDATDANAAATALREAEEEVGLKAEQVQVLGELPLYHTGSAFHVTPVVALIEPTMSLNPNPHEVADVFEVPLSFLMNPAHHRWHRYEQDGVSREWLSMPYEQDGQERYIWGATAGMLRNFYRFLIA
jgi:8-oxo-dGTP pyrophosphatase MutT (NUDIX family)